MDVPALPLQLLLRAHPDWTALPAAVVAEDRPQGLVLHVNEEARRFRVLPGMRWAAALSLASDLRAGTVPADEVARGVAEVATRLRRFTPSVEPRRGEPGVFLLDASGLAGLFPDLGAWAEQIRADLAAAGFRAWVAVGFTAFGAYATARAMSAAAPTSVTSGPRRVFLFADEAQERAVLRRVPLSRLGIDPGVRDLLAKLGVTRVADFLALPPDALGARFGEDVRRLHRLASGDVRDPLLPAPADEPLRETALLDFAETDATRLLFLAKPMTDRLLARLAERREALAALTVRLRLELPGGRAEDRVEEVRPAAPTLDGTQVLDLLRLRLESVRLGAGAVEVEVAVRAVPATAGQLRLFAETPRRDLAAAGRALARLRAEFGEDAVVRARLREAHLPEASFTWERLGHAALPRPRTVSEPPLVRRILARPEALPPRPRHEPDGWLLRGFEHGPVVKFTGPFVVSGGWWAGEEVRREVHFAETGRGHLFWVFYDVRRRRWFLGGEVG